jgi:very-short-patch-repair endonuclease
MAQVEQFCRDNDIRSCVDDEKLWINLSDLSKLLQIKNVHTSIKNGYEKKSFVVKTRGGPQPMMYTTTTGVKRFLSCSRSPRVAEVAAAMNINVHDSIHIKVEQGSIAFIMQAFEGIETVRQYIVNDYRIDLYFPKHKLAIECDEEGGHGGYRVSLDLDRQSFIEEQLGCTFLRFRPEEKSFSLPVLLNRIMKAMQLI